MAEERIDLDAFLEEMIESINKKFKGQDEKIKELRARLDALKKELKSRKEIKVDKSVLNVLRGK